METNDNSMFCLKPTISANSLELKFDFKTKVEKKDNKEFKDQKESRELKEQQIDNTIVSNKEKEKNDVDAFTKVNDRIIFENKDKDTNLAKKEEIHRSSSHLKEKLNVCLFILLL